jgi:hypothetical protein
MGLHGKKRSAPRRVGRWTLFLGMVGMVCALLALAPSSRAQDGVTGETFASQAPHAEFWGELPLDGTAPVLQATSTPRAEFWGELPLEGGAPVLQAAASRAEFWGELPDGDTAPVLQAVLSPGGVNLFLAGHRTGARRYSDTYLANGNRRRRSVATSVRLRRADDANFINRTRFLARRVEENRLASAQLGVATTGEEFLGLLVEASRRGPIANLVVYGHAAPAALFMREDRGFYASVMEVAKNSHVVSGEDVDKDEQLRLVGARDISDFEWLLARGEIRFTRNAVIVFAGCGVAGKRDIDMRGIAARFAEITGAKVIASIDVTDQSMARGRDFRNKEYSRRTWVRFRGAEPPERLNTRVIDALQQMNFEGDVVAQMPAANVPRGSQN